MTTLRSVTRGYSDVNASVIGLVSFAGIQLSTAEASRILSQCKFCGVPFFFFFRVWVKRTSVAACGHHSSRHMLDDQHARGHTKTDCILKLRGATWCIGWQIRRDSLRSCVDETFTTIEGHFWFCKDSEKSPLTRCDSKQALPFHLTLGGRRTVPDSLEKSPVETGSCVGGRVSVYSWRWVELCGFDCHSLQTDTHMDSPSHKNNTGAPSHEQHSRPPQTTADVHV